MRAKVLKVLTIFLALALFVPNGFSAEEKKSEKEKPAAGPSSSSSSGGNSGSGNGAPESNANANSKVQQPIPVPTTTSQPVEVVSTKKGASTPEPAATPTPTPSVSSTPTLNEPVSTSTANSAKGSSSSQGQGNSGGVNSSSNTNQENGKSESKSEQPSASTSSTPSSATTPSPSPSPVKPNDVKQESAKPNPSPQASPSNQAATNAASEKKDEIKEVSKPETKETPSAPTKPKDVGAVSAATSNTGVNSSASKKVVVTPASLKNPKLIAGSVASDLVNASAKQLEKLSADQNCGVPSKASNLSQSTTKSSSSTAAKKSATKTTSKSAATAKNSEQASESASETEPIEECKDFILVFSNDSTKSDIDSAAQSAKGKVLRNFNNVFKGALVNGPPSKILALAKNPKVQAIEMDGSVSTQDVYPNPIWGLDRVDQRLLPLNSSYDDLNNSGFSIPIYIVDSGIYAEHSEFTGRVAPGVTTITDGYGTWDCNGHGTHVAGISAGSNFGVAKTATLIPVRVLGCNGSGTYSGVIAGLDWIAANHPAGVPAVVNMSLSGPASSSLDTAVNNLISRGITVVVAAGNAAADACSYSPARVSAAITVAATSSDDSRANYSNFGSCVDLFAPGTSITSAWNNGVTGSAVASGTSMAAPHVAGVIARFLYLNPTATPAQVVSSLSQSATADVVINPGAGSINRLLFIDLVPAPTPTPTASPSPTRTKKTSNPGKGNKP